MTPGEIVTESGDIELNSGRKVITLKVANSGDRPIQVGSHYHFFETNAALLFDRPAARGYRLNIAAGTAVRFEPGQQRTVELVALAGARIVYGFLGEVMGKLEKSGSGGAGARSRAQVTGWDRAGDLQPADNPATASRGRFRSGGTPLETSSGRSGRRDGGAGRRGVSAGNVKSNQKTRRKGKK